MQAARPTHRALWAAAFLSLSLGLCTCERWRKPSPEAPAAAEDEAETDVRPPAEDDDPPDDARASDDEGTPEPAPEPPPPEPPAPHRFIGDDELAAILGLAETPVYNLDGLLTAEDISELFSTPSTPTAHPVPGLAPSSWHNGVRYIYNPARAGVIFEVRQALSSPHAVQEFESLRRSNYGDTKRIDIGEEGFYSEVDGITRIVTWLPDSLTILSISCDERLCQVPMVLRMLKIVIARLNDSNPPHESSRRTP